MGTSGGAQERFDLLVDQWRALHASAVVAHLHTLQDWAATFEDLRATQATLTRQGRWTSGPSNLMAVLHLSRAEVANCKVVRWLFDPLAHHGLGAHLVTELCMHLSVGLDDPSLVRADAEVAVDDTRADVVLTGTRAGASVVIEAKVDAGEQPDQGARLEARWPSADVYVFLTIGGTRIPYTASDTSKWRPLSWGWIANTADAALIVVPPSTDQRAVDARASVAAWVTSARSNLL